MSLNYSFSGSAADYEGSVGGKYPVAYTAYKVMVSHVTEGVTTKGNPVVNVHLTSDDVDLVVGKKSFTFDLFPKAKNFEKALGKFAYALYASAGCTPEQLAKVTSVDLGKIIGKVFGLSFFPEDDNPQYCRVGIPLDVKQIEEFNASWADKREAWLKDREARKGSGGSSEGKYEGFDPLPPAMGDGSDLPF